MTSYADPLFTNLSDDQVARLPMAPETLSQTLAMRAERGIGSSAAPEPLAYRAGQAIRDVMPTGAQMKDAAINAVPFARPIADAVGVIGDVAHQGREALRGFSGQPSLASQEGMTPVAQPAPGALAQDQPREPAAQPTPAALAPSSGGGGGGALSSYERGIRNEAANLDASTRGNVARIEDANARQSSALAETTRLQSEEAAGKVAYMRELAAGEQQYAADQKAMYAEHDAYMSQQQANLESMMADVRGMKVDPSRLLRSTGNAVKAAISVGLGAIGAALQGKGTNTAMQYLNAAIDRDIAAQEKEINLKRGAVGDQMNLLQIAQQRFDSKASQFAAVRVTAREAIKANIEAQTAQYDSDLIKSNGAALVAKLDAENAKDINTLMSEQSARKMQALAQGASINAQRQSLAIQNREADARMFAATAKADGHIPDLIGRPVSPQAVNDAAKIKAAMDGMRSNLGQIKQLYAEHGSEWFGKNAERYDALLTDMRLQYKELQGLGAVSGPDAEMMESVIKDPNTFFSGKHEERVNTINDAINNSGRARLKALGYMERGQAVDEAAGARWGRNG